MSDTVSSLISTLEKSFCPGFDLTLNRIYTLLEYIENPHKKIPPVIHVAGTNGKGSTVSFAQALLESAQYTTHVHTSPHLVHWRERYRIAKTGRGALIDDTILEKTIHYVLQKNKDKNITIFEIMTAVMFLLFSQYPADACVIEVGLGGRLDATNVINSPAVSVITSISIDHEDFLGSTVEQIATEKAGIIKYKKPVIIGSQENKSIVSLLKKVAKENDAPVLTYGEDFIVKQKENSFLFIDKDETLELSLPALIGKHQLKNAATAIVSVKKAGFSLTHETINLAMQNVRWPGRMQRLDKGKIASLGPKNAEIWIDGGHNPGGAMAIVETIKDWNNKEKKPLFLIVGMIEKKDHIGYFEKFQNIVEHVYTIPNTKDKIITPSILAEKAQKTGLEATPCDSCSDALRRLSKEQASNSTSFRILICGSLFLIGSILNENATPPT